MHKSRIVLVSLALVLMLALLIPLVGCGGGEAVPCKVSSVSGDVQVLKSGSTESVKATNGMELAVDDTITTGSDGSAKLTFFDGSVMEIKANSEILINELSTASTGSTSVSLMEQVGSTVNRVAKLVDSSSKYEVETPAAVAVVRGTTFDVLVQQNGTTTLKTEEGSVSFTAGNQTVIVNAGFQSTAVKGGTPSAVSAVTTPTPTHTVTATKTPTPAQTAAPTSTSTSDKTLSDIYGGGKNIGYVQFDLIITSPQSPQAVTQKYYYKNFGAANQMKYRMEMSEEGSTLIYLADQSTQTAYMWMQETNMAYKIDMSQAPSSNPTKNGDQIHPTHEGTATIDGHPCDIWQWTDQGTTFKMWIWTAKSFPVKMEMTESGETTTMEYKNIDFSNILDSTFQLPTTVQIVQLPG